MARPALGTGVCVAGCLLAQGAGPPLEPGAEGALPMTLLLVLAGLSLLLWRVGRRPDRQHQARRSSAALRLGTCANPDSCHCADARR